MSSAACPSSRRRRSAGALAIALALTAMCSGLPASSLAAGGAGLRRLAIVIASNDGGSDRTPLRYANSDAASIAAVLRGFGGVGPGDLTVVPDATPASLRGALDAAAARITAARSGARRVEVVLYYSGHSDEQGLLPAGQLVPYAELRQRLAGLQVDVRIAILDSCASGAMIRAKGGTRRAPFLLDQSAEVRGHAYLTSSSASETSQESDRIGASYFTHHLVTGLRGAADANRDRRVTLSEAYQYAFHATLDTTQSSRRGPQHPNYDFELAGSGDVVITDLSAAGAVLVLDRGAAGRFFVRGDGGRLVAELDKVPGRSTELGVEPGRYLVELRRGDRAWQVELALQEGQRATVDVGQMRPVALAETRARGGLTSPWQRVSARLGLPSGDASAGGEVRVNIAVVPFVALHGSNAHVTELSVNLLAGLNAEVSGLEVGGVANLTRGDVRGPQFAGVANIVGGGMRAVQGAGVANVVGGDLDGVQIAGVLNLSGDVRGVQVAGIANIASGPVRGVQVSGTLNIGGDIAGVQAGLFNIGARLDGVQVGLANVAGDSEGLQVGLVNVASGPEAETVGLLNFVRGGYNRVELWASDTTALSVGLKFGGRHVYTLVAVGWGRRLEDSWEVGVGWGLHFQPTARLALDVDLYSGSRWTGDTAQAPRQDVIGRLRAQLGLTIWGDVAVFVGASANTAYGLDGKVPAALPLGGELRRDASSGEWVAVGPGLMAGLRF